MWIGDLIRKVLRKLLPQNSIEKELSVEVVTSGAMEQALKIWIEMYNNVPYWKGEGSIALNIPAAISTEFSRLILTEFSILCEGSAEADFIHEQIKKRLSDLPDYVEKYAAYGGIAIKPYVTDIGEDGKPQSINLDFVLADDFYPTAFDSNGRVTAAVFVQTKKSGNRLYTRLEYHVLEGTTYTVTNKAYEAEEVSNYLDQNMFTVKDRFHRQIPLADIPEWAGLSEEPVVIEGIEKPLFVYIKTPIGNNIDTGSPIGVSVYSRAVEAIREADKQYGRLIWEYDATEAAIFADSSLFEVDRRGNPILPEGEERKYITFPMDMTGKSELLKPYSPAIRDASIVAGFNRHLQTIELNCGLAYGTLSDPKVVTKTATEIKMSKDRSYRTVSLMQGAWDNGLHDLVDAMRALIHLYEIVPEGNVEVTCTWGDGVLEDPEAEYNRRWAWVQAGRYKPELFFAWYLGCSVEEAKEMMPDVTEFPSEE